MMALQFYIQVVRALEEIQAPYMIVGAFAGLSYGIARTTFDVDMIVDLRSNHAQALSARFPLPRYYADPQMILNSMGLGIMFNLIDTETGIKVDLVPLSREPEYRLAFSRRIRRMLTDGEGGAFEAWVAQPSDIIVGKLKAWTEGRSAKHPSDIHQMLVYEFSGLSDEPLNMDFIAGQASRMGKETLDLWQELTARARRDTEKKE